MNLESTSYPVKTKKSMPMQDCNGKAIVFWRAVCACLTTFLIPPGLCYISGIMNAHTIRQLGDQAMTVTLGELNLTNHRKVLAVGQWLNDNPFEGLMDVIIAYNSVTVLYDAYRVRMSTLQPCHTHVESALRTAVAQSVVEDVPQTVVKIIPVCYDHEYALDMEWICASKAIAREELISIHTARQYRVYAVGFLPGFPYMAEVDARIAVPRKDKPRSRVPAGSVALAGIQTGIYPVTSPGGWQVIGRTPLTMFDKVRNPPVLLEPGHEVRFEAISKQDFMDLQKR